VAESTLSLSLDDLKGEIGHFLGYGRGTVFGEPAWTTPQSNNITAVLKSGLSQFYTPPPTQPGQAPHTWSFLRPFATITLTSGESVVALPDDFGNFEGAIFITTEGTAYRRLPLDVTNPARVQALHAAQPDTTGAPRIAATEAIKGSTATEGTRFNLYYWPTADQNYTLRAEYKYLPDMLTGLLPYPPGGSEHAETIKAACLASAELHLDDAKGPRWMFFMERLSASVAVDARRKTVTKIGYNADRSDGRGWFHGGNWRHLDNPPVTYNGDDL
jgi:hypothetical protein